MNTETNINTQNSGFYPLEDKFSSRGYKLVKNDMDHIVYTKPGYETEYFEIKLYKTSVHVSVPLTNSKFQYKTSFSNSVDATDYIENHLQYYQSLI